MKLHVRNVLLVAVGLLCISVHFTEGRGSREIRGRQELTETTTCLQDTNTAFTLVEELKSFAEAVEDCKSRNATLARISTSEENDIVISLLQERNIESNIYIGVFADPESEFSVRDPERFVYVDGVENISFFNEAKVFPWISQGPRGDGDCVTITDTAHVWYDTSCVGRRAFVCRNLCNGSTTNEDLDPDSDVPTTPTSTFPEILIYIILSPMYILVSCLFGLLVFKQQQKLLRKAEDPLDIEIAL